MGGLSVDVSPSFPDATLDVLAAEFDNVVVTFDNQFVKRPIPSLILGSSEELGETDTAKHFRWLIWH